MRTTTAIFLFLLLVPAAVRGQSPAGPVSRADVAVSAGWFAEDRSSEGTCCLPWSAGLFKGVSAGYYWTDHVKTEVAFASPGTTEGYDAFSERLANGSYRYTSEHHRYDGTKFTIGQVYQFGRNETFHPFLIGGVDVERERDVIERYVSTAPIPSDDQHTAISTRTKAFAGAGFKAYFSERTFFRGEARFASRSPHEMTWTAGVGVDLGGGRRPASSDVTPRGAVARSREPVEVWRAYVSQLEIGAVVDVAATGRGGVLARFVGADADGVLLKPVTRVAEPIQHVGFEQLEMLALHYGRPHPRARVGATLAGVGAGAGTFAILVTLLLRVVGT